jgi:hypothetical protein
MKAMRNATLRGLGRAEKVLFISLSSLEWVFMQIDQRKHDPDPLVAFGVSGKDQRAAVIISSGNLAIFSPLR